MRKDVLNPVKLTWLAIAIAVLAGVAARIAIGGGWFGLSALFMLSQDLMVLISIGAGAAVWMVLPAWPGGPPGRRALNRIWTFVLARPWAAVLAVAGLCVLVAWAGTWLILDNYPLSMDEFMADFDARIFAHGMLMAPIAPQWRPFVSAIQPSFVLLSPGHTAWSSQYLPINAALRALGRLAGAESLVSPLLAAAAVIATFLAGRRLWPARPELAVVAAVLLATSSQVLLTAMAPYAMTAHMAFDMVWLCLFLRGGRLGHLGAIVVGFFATGLHQFAFHPMFVAPFVLQLLLERRWRLGALYILAYAAICAFWVGYWQVAFATVAEPGSVRAVVDAADLTLVGRVRAILANFGPGAAPIMDMNFIRFVTWQNLLTAPLALLGGVAAFRAKGVARSLALGVILTTAVVFFIMPYQGHGWGYRYWAGLLGSICLLAASAWGGLTEGLAEAEVQAARAAFVGLTLLSALVLFPLRAWQAHRFEHPYSSAEAAIRRAPAGAVLVDRDSGWFTIDLARNSPFLTNRPLVFDLVSLTPVQVDELCARYRIALFDAASAARFGIRGRGSEGRPSLAPSPAQVRRLSCGPDHTRVSEIMP